MNTFLTVLHVCAGLFLILVVLLQTGKGAAMGSAFGGGASQTMFGSSGAGNFLTKLTTAAAVVFMVTSLTLATIGSDKKGDSLLEGLEESVPQETAPAPEFPVEEKRE